MNSDGAARLERITRRRRQLARQNTIVTIAACAVGFLILLFWNGHSTLAGVALGLCACLAVSGAYFMGRHDGIEYVRSVPDFEKHLDDPGE